MSTVLLVGFPNSGKSTIFNLLSGQDRKVSNYAGVTVDTGIGELKSNSVSPEKIKIVDLPGIYNVVPASSDEAITVATLMGLNQQVEQYHSILVVVDFSKLEASLALALSLKEHFGKGVMVLVNKSDLATRQIRGTWQQLEESLGLKVFVFSALSDGEKDLDKFIRGQMAEESLERKTPIALTAKSVEQVPQAWREGAGRVVADEEEALRKIQHNQHLARKIVLKLEATLKEEKILSTYKIDKVLLHPLLGGLVFFSIFYLIFHAVYTWSAPLMEMTEGVVVQLGDWVGNFLPHEMLRSLVVDGLFAGVGGVVVFVPQIAILFFLISLLEQSGYISRAAFISDKIMSYFGLGGRAFLPYLSGFACSIPAIMATRSIPSFKERMATLLTIPFITCSARLPVYILLIGTFIPATNYGPFQAQALALFFLYFLGSAVALVMAKVFRLSLFKGQTNSFFMEMPLYERPSLKVALNQGLKKSKIFLKRAGTVILGLSLIIWVMSTFPRPAADLVANKSAEEVAALSLENSYLGRLGHTIEPIMRPLGYDWKMSVGILVAFGARELFVSALGTIYALGDVSEESVTLRERLLKEVNPQTGLPVYNLAVAASLLIFFAFACQCVSTLAVVKRETGGWYWPSILFIYMGVIAYVFSFLTYRLLL